MREWHLQIIGIVLTVTGLGFVAFLYTTQPRSLAEVTTKGSVVIGTYEVDRAKFDEGVASFKKDEFVVARDAFERADPERRDAATQFYIAYGYYRQGWGRVSNDDALFQAGIEAANRVIAIDPNYRATDPSLVIKTPVELKAELEEGLKVTADDFNPMKLMRERK
jgi:hypothetical protein